jgi:hypothetical protein
MCSLCLFVDVSKVWLDSYFHSVMLCNKEHIVASVHLCI